MNIFLRYTLAAAIPLAMNAAAASGAVNLVKPVAPPAPVPAISGGDGTSACANGLVQQSDGRCCPAGTGNTIWPWVCTPPGLLQKQLFNGPEGPLYCPGADMYIVGNRNGKWFSCATGDSTPLYPDAKTSAGQDFCTGHGYGYLIRINPWGTAGCVKVGDSQGDGCIEAGSCSYQGGR